MRVVDAEADNSVVKLLVGPDQNRGGVRLRLRAEGLSVRVNRFGRMLMYGRVGRARCADAVVEECVPNS